MVLTEAFAAGTPVVASDIAGYRDVVTDGVDGLLVPRGDATRAGRDAARPRARPARASSALGAAAARERASATPGRGSPSRSSTAYEDARAVPAPESAAGARRGADRRAARRRPAARRPPAACRRSSRCPSGGTRRVRIARRAAARRRRAGHRRRLAASRSSTSGCGGSATRSCARSPAWVLVGLALMCVSMLLRAVSWHAILKAALPEARPRLVDAIQGTTIGVLMSATLPARLGEPSRALVVARRLGRPRERLPVVLGTIVSQTLINVLALVILGAVMFTTIGLFAGRQQALLWYALAPLGVLLRRARGAGAAALRPAVALGARAPLGGAGARRARARALGPDRVPPPAARRRSRSRCSSAPGRCSGSPATCCSSRSGSSTRPTSAPPPRCCSRSTSPPCCR